jgi:hypothetical protein
MKPFVEPQAIRLRLSAFHFNSSDAIFHIEPSIETEPLQFRFTDSIKMPHSSILRLDSTIWRLTGRNANQTRFFVDRQPEHGSIVLQVTTGKFLYKKFKPRFEFRKIINSNEWPSYNVHETAIGVRKFALFAPRIQEH